MTPTHPLTTLFVRIIATVFQTWVYKEPFIRTPVHLLEVGTRTHGSRNSPTSPEPPLLTPPGLTSMSERDSVTSRMNRRYQLSGEDEKGSPDGSTPEDGHRKDFTDMTVSLSETIRRNYHPDRLRSHSLPTNHLLALPQSSRQSSPTACARAHLHSSTSPFQPHRHRLSQSPNHQCRKQPRSSLRLCRSWESVQPLLHPP